MKKKPKKGRTKRKVCCPHFKRYPNHKRAIDHRSREEILAQLGSKLGAMDGKWM